MELAYHSTISPRPEKRSASSDSVVENERFCTMMRVGLAKTHGEKRRTMRTAKEAEKRKKKKGEKKKTKKKTSKQSRELGI